MEKLKTTLLLVIKNNKILLAQKKRGFGESKFNGVGGKVEGNETFEEAMLRETMEEVKITPVDYTQLATITFDEYVKGKKTIVEMALFVAEDLIGKPKETEEMRPVWFDLKEIPFDRMFPDDSYWMPYVLAGKHFNAKFKFDENFNLLSHSIDVVSDKKAGAGGRMLEGKRKRARAIIFLEEKLVCMYREFQGRTFYTFPGGGMEENESEQECVVREVLEEFGLNVKPVKKVYVYENEKSLEHFYICEAISGVFGSGDGEEFHNNGANGVYKPMLISMEEVPNIPLMPPEVAKALVEDFKLQGKNLRNDVKYV